MKKYYVYKTINKLNDHFYVGVHGTSNIDDGYIGTGKRMKAAKRKYGPDAFYIESRIACDSADEAFELEALLVDETLLANPMCYNLTVGGRGGEHRRQRKPYTKRKGVPHTPESKANISKAKSNLTTETKAKMSAAAKARIEPLSCPHCGVVGFVPNIKRWHFTNCKNREGYFK